MITKIVCSLFKRFSVNYPQGSGESNPE